MSGAGKSFWARRLSDERGFAWRDCDLDIARRLGELVTPAEGEEPVHAVGRWMGMPFDEGYSERESRYLALETEVTAAALERVCAGTAEVLDTTGSVVHLADELRNSIHERTRVVYLRTPPQSYERMLRRYLEEPKPVAWGGLFTRTAGETPQEALARCYPELLVERDRRYRALAHVVLDAEALETGGADLVDFVRAVETGAGERSSR